MTPERKEEIKFKIYDYESKYQDRLIKKQGYAEDLTIKCEILELLKFMKESGILLEEAFQGLSFINEMTKKCDITIGELTDYLIEEDNQVNQNHNLSDE